MSSLSTPPQYRAVGIALAVGSGALIGSSFVFKKKGLLASQGDNLGEGVAYLRNAVWWTGMILMILGELCNFGAYAFVSAIVVTPMGALSVVICAILSSIFLQEKLTLIGWIGCCQCIVGSVIIALNAPEQQSVNTISALRHLFLAPGFLAFGSVVIAFASIIAIFVAPKRGKTNMIWYILICSLIGGLSVSCTQGLGSCIVTSIRGESQFKNWFIYFLMAFVAVTLVTEIYFLNMALALFNTAMVTPVYFTLFTTCTLVTSLVLYQGVKASKTQILTVVLGFLVICGGVSLLQLSKVDPSHLRNLDRRTSILLQAAREEVKPAGDHDPEKGLIASTEEPGIDALRGTFGGLGTISRARRRQSISSGADTPSHRRSTVTGSYGRRDTIVSIDGRDNLAGRGLRRFQLHDAPGSRGAAGSSHPPSSFPADLVSGKKKKRDSHDSDAAVQGSAAGDLPLPQEIANGDMPALHEKNPGDSFNLDGKEGTTEEDDISMGVLSAQRQWEDRHASTVQDTGIENPGTSHATIQFIEPRQNHRYRAGAVDDIPPILHTPPILSPRQSSPSLPISESTANHSSSGLSPEHEARQHNFDSPRTITPVRTPEEELLVYPAPHAQRRAAISIVRQILDEAAESVELPARSPATLVSRHSHRASPSTSRSPTEDERPLSRKSHRSTALSGSKSSDGATPPPARMNE